MAQKQMKNGAMALQEPRWFIWTITLLIVIGVSLSGYIIVSAEKETNQALETPLPIHIVKGK